MSQEFAKYYIQELKKRDVIESNNFQKVFQDNFSMLEAIRSLNIELQNFKQLQAIDRYSQSQQSQGLQKEERQKLLKDLNEQMKQNQEQTNEIIKLSKQTKQLEDNLSDTNRQLMKVVREKQEALQKLQETEKAMQDIVLKHTVMAQEYNAFKDTNNFLEKKVRLLTAENQQFLNQLMDLKEKQIEKLDQANELYKEVETMKAQLQLSKIPRDVLSQISDILKNGDRNTLDKIMQEAKKIYQSPAGRKSSDSIIDDKTSMMEEQIFMQSRGQSMLIPSSSSLLSQEAQLYNEITQNHQNGYKECTPSSVEFKFHAHEKEGTCVKFNNSGNLLASGGADSVIKIWDLNRQCESTPIKSFQKPISCMSFARDSESLMMACSIDRKIQIFNVKPYKLLQSLSGHSASINCCSFTYSSKLALTASSDRTIKIWNYITGQNQGTMACASETTSVDISITDSIAVSGHKDGNVRLWSIRDHSLMKEIKNVHDDSITCVQYMPDGNSIITNSKDHSIRIIDTRMFQVVKTIENENYINSNETNTFGLSPSGHYLAVGSRGGKLLIFNTLDGEVEEIFDREHTTSIVACDWSNRGSKVATIDSIGILFVWQ
eukprot:403338836